MKLKIVTSALLSLFLLLDSGCRESPETAVPKLMKALKSADPRTRSKAAHDLAAYGVEAADAVPILVGRLRDSNGGVKSAAAFALRKIDTPEAREALSEAVKSGPFAK